MLSNLKVNNDSLLHWCLGPLVGWALLWLVVGIPIHFALGIRSSSIALSLAVQCALQIAVMPWLFGARATASNPQGQTLRRTKVVIVWLTLACEAAFLQMSGGDFTDRAAVTIFLGGPIFVGSISLIAFHWFKRRQVEAKQSDS
jgi:hypothetical protein